MKRYHSPVVMPVTDVMTGLQTDLLDSVTAPPVGAVVFQWHTRVKYITDVPLAYVYAALLIDKRVFSKVSPEDQAVVEPVGLALPELDLVGHDPVPTPEGRKGDFAPAEPLLHLFDAGAGADVDLAATGAVGLAHAMDAVDDRRGREVRGGLNAPELPEVVFEVRGQKLDRLGQREWARDRVTNAGGDLWVVDGK